MANIPSHRRYIRVTRMLCLAVTLLILFTPQATFAQNGMACNDEIQVSLYDDCTHTFWPDDILEDQSLPDEAYTITIQDENGVEVGGPTINSEHIGQRLTVKIVSNISQIGCWTYVTVKDKFNPIFPTCENGVLPDAYVRCTEVESADDYLSFPDVEDNCSADADITLTYVDAIENTQCGNAGATVIGFDGDFEADEATVNGTGSVTNSSLASITINNQTNYCYTIETPGKITFRWEYENGNDQPAGLAPFGYSINGVVTQLTDGRVNSMNGASIQQSTATVDVIPGQVFCFYQLDRNNPSNTTTTINTFTFVPQGIIQVITRSWKATDSCGNETTCQQKIKVLKGDISTVIPPPHYDLPDSEPETDTRKHYFSCDDTTFGVVPSPDVTGRPTGELCDNIQIIYDDSIVPVCGASYKVLRRWRILDWCTGEEYYVDQIIKITDSRPPICVAMDEFQVFTDNHNCTTSFEVPDLITVFDCAPDSLLTLEVGYKIKRDGDDRDSPFSTFTAIPQSSDGKFRVSNIEVPQDSIWFAYRLTDPCGFVCEARNEAELVDDEAPTAVCEGFSIVTLAPDGYAKAFATSFNDHSYDNCAVDSFAVKRLDSAIAGHADDLQFGDHIHFGCSDVGNGPIRVMLRVFDADGNYSDCIIEADVQEKFPPKIDSCPNDVSVDCIESTEPSSTGMPTYSDNCSATLDYKDTENIDACGIGSIIRVWTVTDGMGQLATCSHTINVGSRNPFTINDITFPGDTEAIGCSTDDADPAQTGEPIIRNQECISLTYGYEDQVFYNITEACAKIVRTWTIIDWCKYDITHPNPDARWIQSQTIILRNNEKPQFTDPCQDLTIGATTKDCEGYVELIRTADDDCTPASELEYSYDIDLNYNPSIGFIPDLTKSGNDASGIYPTGTHQIKFFAIDRCGNIGICSFDFEIKDQNGPTIICLGNLSFALPDSGVLEIWASDFIKESLDNCSDTPVTQTFSFTSDPRDANRSFTCEDIPNGAIEEIEINIYAFDSDGNSSFCTTTFTLSDNKDVCPNATGSSVTISGMVTDPTMDAIHNVEVSMYNKTMDQQSFIMTNTVGEYTFTDVERFYDYALRPMSKDDYHNGVSTLDLVLIQQHILGLKDLDSPYKILAADVNNSNSISTADLVQLRKLILGINTEFPNNDSWIFVDTNHTFDDPTQPYNYGDDIQISSIQDAQSNADFIAVKVGDVSGNAVYNDLVHVEGRTNDALHFDVNRVERDAKIRFDFTPENFNAIRGFQLGLQYDPAALDFVSIESAALSLTSSHYSAIDNNVLISWNSQQSLTIDAGETSFSLVFTKKTQNQLDSRIELGSALIQTEAYNDNFEVMDIQLSSQAVGSNNSFSLLQNTPNPFNSTTTIGFSLPKRDATTLSLYDIHGKLIHKISETYAKGYNEILLDLSEHKGIGVIYYKLESGEYAAIKKMIIID